MIADPAESARLALYCMAAEDAGPVAMPQTSQEAQGAVVSGGPPLPAWIARDYALAGWLSGMDSYFEGLLNLGAHRVFYAWVLQAASGELVIVIRGTEGAAEWAIDAEIAQATPHGVKGHVETGFWSLAQTLEFRGLDGRDVPVTAGIASLKPAAPVTVAGHSLGAAAATFVTLELAETGVQARGRFIASPHPGDADFADYFAQRVPDHAVYAYQRDIVPQVPTGMGYCALPNLIMLPATNRVRDTILCNHHAASYALEIHELALSILPPGANRFAACLLPP